MSVESFDCQHFFSQLIDDFVGVESSPTEKQRKWREVTRYILACLLLLSVSPFFSFHPWLFHTHSRLICNCLICECKCKCHYFIFRSYMIPFTSGLLQCFAVVIPLRLFLFVF